MALLLKGKDSQLFSRVCVSRCARVLCEMSFPLRHRHSPTSRTRSSRARSRASNARGPKLPKSGSVSSARHQGQRPNGGGADSLLTRFCHTRSISVSRVSTVSALFGHDGEVLWKLHGGRVRVALELSKSHRASTLVSTTLSKMQVGIPSIDSVSMEAGNAREYCVTHSPSKISWGKKCSFVVVWEERKRAKQIDEKKLQTEFTGEFPRTLFFVCDTVLRPL